MNGFDLSISISALTVFLQGILSFFSPCVLPLVPLYIGYLSGGTRRVEADGTITYDRKKVLVNTIFFILGVSFAFFLLGLGFTALGQFFSDYQQTITVVGGILILLFGIYQLGIFGQNRLLASEHRLPFRLEKMTMSPITALVFGFTFSFAWTPCVGPALTSVLLMAGSAETASQGFLLIGVYTLGFVLPFLLIGFFTGTLLELLKQHRGVVRLTVRIGAVLMILMGLFMATGLLGRLSATLSSLDFSDTTASVSDQETPEEDTEYPTDPAAEEEQSTEEQSTEEDATEEKALYPAPDFTLYDQYGNEHTLSDYEGKTIFLNFWATWCGPCKMEMPDIQALYEAWDENDGDLVVLGVANPSSEKFPLNSDVTEEEIVSFLEENGYTYPVLMDTDGSIFYQYGIQSFPTTFMITEENTIYGYVSGTISREIMDDIVEQTMSYHNP